MWGNARLLEERVKTGPPGDLPLIQIFRPGEKTEMIAPDVLPALMQLPAEFREHSLAFPEGIGFVHDEGVRLLVLGENQQQIVWLPGN